MAADAKLWEENTIAVTTNMTRLNPGVGVRTVWVTGDVAINVVHSATDLDGQATPSDVFQVAAGVAFPIEIPDNGRYTHISGASAGNASLMGIRG